MKIAGGQAQGKPLMFKRAALKGLYLASAALCAYQWGDALWQYRANQLVKPFLQTKVSALEPLSFTGSKYLIQPRENPQGVQRLFEAQQTYQILIGMKPKQLSCATHPIKPPSATKLSF